MAALALFALVDRMGRDFWWKCASVDLYCFGILGATVVFDTFDKALAKVTSWPCADQMDFATRVAANIGYKLVPDNPSYDEPTLAERVERLEKIVNHICPDKSDDI